MANTGRRKIDSTGKTFIPMNMDIASDNDEFMSLPKIATITLVLFGIFLFVLWGKSVGLSLFGWVLFSVLLFIASQFLIRYIVFQERYYYKIWKRDRSFGNPKASIFWNISSIRKTNQGDLLIYADLKIGCILELEKDTIIGRESDNMEKHFDAWSEFYKYLNQSGYKYVQMNIMEPAGKDVRLDELSDIASSAKNKNVRKLLEIQTGHMKEISRATLNEKDYILIYTQNTNKMNMIIPDAIEAAGKLLAGAYSSVHIMSEVDIFQLPKELLNVDYFDGVEAQMDVYKHSGYSIKTPVHIAKIRFSDGTYQDVSEQALKKIEKASTLMDNGKISLSIWSLENIIAGKFQDGSYAEMVNEDEAPVIHTMTTAEEKVEQEEKERTGKNLSFGSVFKKSKKTKEVSERLDTEAEEDTEGIEVGTKRDIKCVKDRNKRGTKLVKNRKQKEEDLVAEEDLVTEEDIDTDLGIDSDTASDDWF